LLPKFEQFIREQQYLHNVSPATVSWHTHNLKWLPSEYPTEDELKAMVVPLLWQLCTSFPHAVVSAAFLANSAGGK
jgi:hypothetical protein